MGIIFKDNEAMATEKEKEYLPQIKDSFECTVEIRKDNSGLGLQIVGGSDTYLTGIVIKNIDPNGAVAKDKRLKVGDQILEVNDVSLREIPHQKAVSTLRVAASPVRLVILREDPEQIFTTKETPKSLIKVRLHKSISENLGLSILARKDGNGVFVTYVTEGSVTDLEGTIQQGDRIMEVNKQDLRNATQEHAAQVLKRCYGNIKLTIGRVPSVIATIKDSANKRQQFGYVNHGLNSDDKDSPRRHRSSSYGSHIDFSKRITSTPKDDNHNEHVKSKQRRRSATMLDQPENDDLRVGPHLENKQTVEPETLQLTIEETTMRQQMLESYGREDYV
ncbi:inaD-like protein [Actinia tenebrosa]|uniref:InaD-like protein n=1 Tax=Actinia tenebrosa TaxID=6105 RepID=A0A6P8HG86_ACTTE|nr:inaD-like protein [Actinia tenebrosa]